MNAEQFFNQKTILDLSFFNFKMQLRLRISPAESLKFGA